MASPANLSEIHENRKILNPDFIQYIRGINKGLCNQLGEGYSCGSCNAFAIIPKIDNHIFVYTLLKYHGAFHGEIYLKVKLRGVLSKEEVFVICKKQTRKFNPKLKESHVYIDEKYTPRMIFNKSEALLKRLERSDFPLQTGDVIYNYIMNKRAPLGQYLIIERRMGALIQQSILNNSEFQALKLVEMNSIDPHGDSFFVAFFTYFIPCCCCFKEPSVFDQENEYEQIEPSE